MPHRIVSEDTYSIVTRVIPNRQDDVRPVLAAAARRLYRVAGEIGATKIALGHHRDDIVETLFLNLFYGGS